MSSVEPDHNQTMQRVRVGMTGLAAVLVLIGIGSAVFTTASNEEPVEAIGTAKRDVVADIATGGNQTAPKDKDEALAELGVTPGSSSTAENSTQPAPSASPAP